MTCAWCTDAEPHAFRVRVVDTEGPAWWVEVMAIGPHDARNQAREKAYDQGADEPAVLAVEHEDQWQRVYGPEAAGLAVYQAEGR